MVTPYAAYVYQSKTATVYMMALLRFMMGMTQGKWMKWGILKEI